MPGTPPPANRPVRVLPSHINNVRKQAQALEVQPHSYSRGMASTSGGATSTIRPVR